MTAALGGCGSGGKGSDGGKKAGPQPGKGKPPVRLATKNFTEQFVLGQLYAQALQARGYTVVLKSNVGSSEIVDRALVSGGVDMYPEYAGVIVRELAGESRRPRSPRENYTRAAQFESRRGFALLAMTPGSDSDINAVRPDYARKHRLKSTADLAKVGKFRYGAPPEGRTRFQGAVGMRQVYGLRFTYVPLRNEDRYRALDDGRVDVSEVFSTEGQLTDHKRYVLLTDPKGIFGFQNIVPVVSKRVLAAEGPEFRRTIDAVSAKLTNGELQKMNAAVDVQHRPPATVARQFLQANGLL